MPPDVQGSARERSISFGSPLNPSDLASLWQKTTLLAEQQQPLHTLPTILNQEELKWQIYRYALLEQTEEESFSLAHFNELLDDTMRVVFLAGVAIGAMNFSAVLNQMQIIAKNFNLSWNFSNTLTGAVDVAAQTNINIDKRNPQRKMITKVYRPAAVGALAFLGAGTGLTMAGFPWAMILGSVSLGNIAFAAGLWVMVGKLAADLNYAIQKTDRGFLLRDRVTKRDKVFTALQKSTTDLIQAYRALLSRHIQENIPRLPNDFDELLTLRALAYQHEATINQNEKDRQLFKRLQKLEKARQKNIRTYIRLKTQAAILSDLNNYIPPSADAEKACLGREIILPDTLVGNTNLQNTLLSKQQAKVQRLKLTLAGTTLAAIGVTLFALSPLTGPAAPFLAVAGLAIAAIGGTILLGEMLYRRFSAMRTKGKMADRIQNILLNNTLFEDDVDYSQLIDRKTIFPNDVTDRLERLKYRLAFEKAINQSSNKNLRELFALPDEREISFEKHFYEALRQQPNRARKKQLDQALDEKIESVILRTHLRGFANTTLVDDSRESIKALEPNLTKHDKRHLLKEACKPASAAYRHFFFKPPKLMVSGDTSSDGSERNDPLVLQDSPYQEPSPGGSCDYSSLVSAR